MVHDTSFNVYPLKEKKIGLDKLCDRDSNRQARLCDYYKT